MDSPNRIREFRTLRGLTSEELAEAVGTTQATISRLEQGKQALTLDWMRRIAVVFGIRTSDLVEFDDALSFAHVIGDLRVPEKPVFRPSQIYSIPVPARGAYTGKYLVAFETEDHGWLIAERVQSLTEAVVARTYVVEFVSKIEERRWFEVRTFERSASGPGFISNTGDPAKRWLPAVDKSIARIWRAISEYREFP